ncbi:PaaI family thioesterase [Halorhodospira halochloris]|uniref:PaaI family thioesterase n=1 Tax=Halorhodospira halochloris TaxID=1052 RepID=UPI001EE86509|nr:PaaI family thioesterase [Halorhodospira halochloris]MCG5547906.1 PaaI family thioesterase [Halorhodospira halochloris]
MVELLEQVRAARAEEDYSALSRMFPYASLIGIEVEPDECSGADPGQLLMSMPYRDDLIGRPGSGSLHGGLLGAFLEHASIVQILWNGESRYLPRIVNFHIDYLRRGAQQKTFAGVEIRRQGRRVANVHALAWQGNRQRPIAAARGHFLLTPPE